MGTTCIVEGCGRPIENRDTGLCATHSHEMRKAQRQADNRKAPTPIKKVSKKQSSLLRTYTELNREFLKGKRCAVTGAPATETHHMMGRQGYADEGARLAGVPLLLDTRYWLPVSSEAHQKITTDSKWAIKMGYSLPRIGKKEK